MVSGMAKRGVLLLMAGFLLSGCDVLGIFGDDSPEGGEMAWWHDHDLGVYPAMPALSSTTAFVGGRWCMGAPRPPLMQSRATTPT